jgi:hypothetical protein
VFGDILSDVFDTLRRAWFVRLYEAHSTRDVIHRDDHYIPPICEKSAIHGVPNMRFPKLREVTGATMAVLWATAGVLVSLEHPPNQTFLLRELYQQSIPQL